MKKFILYTLTVSLFLMSMSFGAFAADDFTVTAKVNFDTSELSVTIKTPALYDQDILVTVYSENALITAPAQYLRIGQVRADKNGDALISFNIANFEKGRYTVSATGGGKLAGISYDTFNFYFETETETNTVTIPALSTAEGNTLKVYAERFESDYGLVMGDGYSKDEEKFLSLFETVRLERFNNSYSSMGDVQETIDVVNLIMKTLDEATSAQELQALYEEKCSLFSIFDMTDEDYAGDEQKDYPANAEEIYPILMVIAKDNEENIKDLSDIRKHFLEAQAVATVNVKNSATMTATVEKYYVQLGIDLEDYQAKCKKYGDLHVNPDLVGRNFVRPSQVLEAYKDSVKALTSTGSGSGGGGGGTTGGSTSLKGENITKTDAVLPETAPLPAVSFSDVKESHWANEHIKKLAQYGVIGGFEDGSFRPEEEVTREQFVKMVVEAFGIKAEAEQAEFSDVPADHWANEFIAIAVDKGIITGISETEFGTGKTLTRQDAAVIIARVADYAGYSLEGSNAESFTDKDAIAQYALESVTRLSKAGIINGMGNGEFSPVGTLTRAQAAKILHMMIINK